MRIPIIKDGDELICPICGKTFIANKDTKYIAGGGYTCTWQCFLTRVKEREREKEEQKKNVTKL